MLIPRQLAPTVGLAHGGVEFLKGSLQGFEKLVNFLDEERISLKDMHQPADFAVRRVVMIFEDLLNCHRRVRTSHQDKVDLFQNYLKPNRSSLANSDGYKESAKRLHQGLRKEKAAAHVKV